MKQNYQAKAAKKKLKKPKKPKFSKRVARVSRRAEKSSTAHIRKNIINRLAHIKNVRLLVLEWLLLISAIIALAIAQTFLYRSSYATDDFTSGGTYTEATLGEVKSLNPLFASTNSERTLSKLMFATLTANDASGHSGLALAEKVRVDDGGKVWRIKLRDDLKWSDGEPLTNQDVLFTVGLIQNPAVNSSYSSNLSGVTVKEVSPAMEQLDDTHANPDSDSENASSESAENTASGTSEPSEVAKNIENSESISNSSWLEFTLPAAYANFSSALNIPILPEHILRDVEPTKLLESDFNNNPITSGPFTYNASQANKSAAAENTYYLKSNPYYYLSQPLIDTFAVSTFPDTNGIINALNSGSVSATAELQSSDANKITNPNIYQKQTSLHSGVYAFINTTSDILGDKSLRQSLRQGIDPGDLRSGLTEQPLDYPLLTSQLALNYPELPAHDFDAAHQAIGEADFDHQSSLQIATVSTGDLSAVTNKLADELRTLGFKAEVTVYEPDQDFLVNVVRPRSYDILVYEIELGTDADLFAYYHSSQARSGGLNLSNYRKALTDDLLLATRTTLDPHLRATKYENFLKSWIADVPAIGIYQSNLTYYFDKSTSNFSEDNHLVSASDRFLDVHRWSATRALVNRTP